MSAALSEHDLRPYQAEMLEESMKGNIIVAMDTGSGKTLMYLQSPRHYFLH